MSSRASSLSSASSSSSSSSGASIGSWDSLGNGSHIDQSQILVNGQLERVPQYYDNASTKPLPGQQSLRLMNGEVKTAWLAADDRRLKEKLKYIGVTGKKNRLTFETIDQASRRPHTGTQTPLLPDFSAGPDSYEFIMKQQARQLRTNKARPSEFTRPQKIILNGRTWRPSSYYENIVSGKPNNVLPLPGQRGVSMWEGNYSEHVAENDKVLKARLKSYVGHQNSGKNTYRAFRTASYDARMSGSGDGLGKAARSVDFLQASN